MKDISIITPVFNTEDYLHRCIKSIINQKGVDIEIIFIDDGSTDNSNTILNYYQKRDPRIKVISKNNEGQGKARNLGIKIADAEYIYFVDSDDFLGENTLLKLFNSSKKNQLDICSPLVPKHYFEKTLEQIPCVPCKSQFVKLDIVRKFEIFQPDVRTGQDGVFSHLLLSHCERIGMHNKATFHYTHAREGSTFKKYLNNHRVVPEIIRKHLEFINDHYDKHQIWPFNALRFYGFLESETLRNRVEPHLQFLKNKEKLEILNTIGYFSKKAFRFLSEDEKKLLSPLMISFSTEKTLEISKFENLINLKNKIKPLKENSNFVQGNTFICKLSNPKYIEFSKKNNEIPNINKNKIPEKNPNKIENKLDNALGKIDLAINLINNSNIQLKSSLMNLSEKENVSHNNEVIVSLTTLPKRLHLVHFAIESIISQTIKPKNIILWITKNIDLNLNITSELINLKNRGLEIFQVDDLGPHTKLLYALKKYPNNPIVTIDDDIVYPINMIEKLLDNFEKNNNSIICNWAREIAFDSKGIVRGVRKGILLTPPLLEKVIEQAESYNPEPNPLAFPYGTSGVLYPPNSLDKRVFDEKLFQKLCPKEDDIWFKAMSLLKGTDVVVTNLGINPSHYCISGSQSYALRHNNHGKGENEEQMKKVFNYFNLNKESIKNNFINN